MPLDLIIFDMDGLILDSERHCLHCFHEVLTARGLSWDDTFDREIVGFSDRSNIETLARRYPGEDAEALFAAMARLHRARMDAGEVPFRPGVPELLDAIDARGLRKAVATSTGRDHARQALEAKGILHRFDGAVFGDMVPRRKPAPDIYRLCLDTLGAAPGTALVLEDSVPGVQAGLAAGMRVVMVPDVVQPDPELRAKLYRLCGSLHDVIPLLDRFPA